MDVSSIWLVYCFKAFELDKMIIFFDIIWKISDKTEIKINLSLEHAFLQSWESPTWFLCYLNFRAIVHHLRPTEKRRENSNYITIMVTTPMTLAKHALIRYQFCGIINLHLNQFLNYLVKDAYFASVTLEYKSRFYDMLPFVILIFIRV